MHVLKFSFAALLAVTLTVGVAVLGQPAPAEAFPTLSCPPPCGGPGSLQSAGLCIQPSAGGGIEYCKQFRNTFTGDLCTTTCIAP